MDNLIICGLGVRVPEETTLETLQALGERRVVYSDLDDKKARAWLSGYCRELKRPASAEEVVAAAREGGAALAVWGHPQFSSRLAREVELAAQRAGLPLRVLGAISPIGSVFARSVSFLGGDYGYQGIQSYSVETLLEDPAASDGELPLVLYSESAAPAQWAAALARLAAGYPAGHRARHYPASGAESEGPLTKLAPGARSVLLIPPAKPLPAPKRKPF